MNRKEFFDQLAPEWERSAPPDLASRLKRVVSMSGTESGDAVLDVGTGTGVFIPHILEAVGRQGRVVAIDISPEMISTAKRKKFPSNVELHVMDAHSLGFPDATFDKVMCNAVFPHFDNKKLALRELRRVLRPGGRIIISHPIGREAVNKLHRETGSAVAQDRVPVAEQMKKLLEEAGFVGVCVVDEPEFYIALAQKPKL